MLVITPRLSFENFHYCLQCGDIELLLLQNGTVLPQFQIIRTCRLPDRLTATLGLDLGKATGRLSLSHLNYIINLFYAHTPFGRLILITLVEIVLYACNYTYIPLQGSKLALAL